jgi:hypothetical protein
MLRESRMTCGVRERQKQSTKEMAIDYQTLIAIDSCLMRNPDTKMEVLESVHDMLVESRTMCDFGVCSSDGRWEEADKIRKRFV